MINIIDIDIEELSIYKKIRDNAFDEQNSFIADSPKVVNLLLQTDIEVKSILATIEYYDEFRDLIATKDIEKLYVTTKAQMQKIVGHKIHHNVMMHGIRPAETQLEKLGDSVIMLDGITSSENVGSIARSGAGLGVDGYLLSKTSPHPFGRRALRVSMGHITMLNTHIYSDIAITIERLKELGYKIFGAEIVESSTPLSKLLSPEKWVLIMGHEGKGLSTQVINLCDEIIQIEMQDGVKSFNVAVASSLIIYKLKHN